MQITATELKQNVNLLSKLKEEEIVVSKRGKPFAVVVDYEKYQELVQEQQKKEIERKIKILENLPKLEFEDKDYAEIKKDMEV